jgi:hypothetical protein
MMIEYSSVKDVPGMFAYSIDGGEWSAPVRLSVGEHELFDFQDLPEQCMTPGEHTVELRMQQEGSADFNVEETSYYVNAAPSVQLTKQQPLSFKSVPSAAVALPISVSDADGDSVTVIYRFEGEDDWSEAQLAHGECLVPADEFEDRWAQGNGVVEVFGWDGCETSGNPLKIAYSTAGDAAQPEANEEAVDEGSGLFGGLSPAVFVVIAVGGVAVIAFIIGIVLFIKKKKSESSTGLIEAE